MIRPTGSTVPRVLHLTTTPVSLDWLLAPQLEAFDAAGFDVVTASAPGQHVVALDELGIEHHQIDSLSRNMDLASDRRAWTEIQELLRLTQPDILHTHNPKPGVLGRLLGHRHGVPIVVNTVHGLYAQPSDGLARRSAVYAAERMAAACSDAELVQNVEDVGLLRSLGVPSDRVHLLGNGIDLERFRRSVSHRVSAMQLRKSLGIDANKPVVGIVGRLVWEKGYREFFDAVTALRSAGRDDVDFVVVGPSEAGKDGAVDQETLDDMTARGVHFLGSRSDIEVILSMFDLFVLPSYREGFPRAAMEASAMGLPVIATNIRGCRQVVDDGVTGLLVEPRRFQPLATAIADLLDDPVRSRQMGLAAIARAEAEFDQRRVIARTLAVYRSTLLERGLPLPQARTAEYSDSIDLVATDASKFGAVSAAA